MRYGWPPIGPVETREQAVYLLSTPTGHYKVGISSNPASRLSSLQSGCPFPITLLGHTLLSEGGVDAAEMERRIHWLLAPFRSSGEWFEAPYDRILAAWKWSWTSLARPAVVDRLERMRNRRQAEKAK